MLGELVDRESVMLLTAHEIASKWYYEVLRCFQSMKRKPSYYVERLRPEDNEVGREFGSDSLYVLDHSVTSRSVTWSMHHFWV